MQVDDAIRKLVAASDWEYSTGLVARVMARGHRDVLEEMISRGADLEVGHGVARYSEAVAKAPGMREWLASRDLQIPEVTDNERLIGAAERGDIPEMRRLLREGANVNFYGENGWTPLTKAATWGQPKAVKLLLEHHADPNIPKSYDYSALCLAKTAEIADMLFKAGAALNAEKPEDHIVWYAMQQGNDGVVKWFMDHGVDLTKVGRGDRMTALFLAGSPQIAEWLIERGVDVNARNEFGETALVQALSYKDRAFEIAKVLLKHGADPNAGAKFARTPLMVARDGETVDLLVAAGADLNAKDESGYSVAASPIHNAKPSRYEALARHGAKIQPQADAPALASRAILDGNHERMKMLLDQGLDPNSRSSPGEKVDVSLLALAISFGQWPIVDLLREAGATDVGALSEAAARGDLQKMNLLLASGSELDERDKFGFTPLFYATRRANVEAVKFLLDRGADVNAFTISGGNVHSLTEMLRQSSAREAEMYKEARAKKESTALTEIQALLNARQPDVNTRNGNGETVLHVSAAMGGFECGLLISQGADVNARNKDGMTPLMLAIVNQVPDAKKIVTIRDPKAAKEEMYSASGYVVKQLLDKGADRNLKNTSGQTAMDLAKEKGDAEILALMEAKP
jgi:ankyrin repeat protein